MNNKAERILAAIIDFTISCFLSSVLTGIFTLGEFNVTPLSLTVYLISYVLLLLMRDSVFKNASIGKRIFKLEIAKTDGANVTIVDVLKRNAPLLVLLPVEVFLVMANDRRLGDVWAKTSIVCNISGISKK